MAKVDFKTLLMKLNNIFPKDVYIVHNWCAIAGDESDIENRGFYICIFDSETQGMLNKTFPNNPTLYIKSIRETKTDFSKIQEILDDKMLKNIETSIATFMSSFNNIDMWDTFSFTDEEKTSLFDIGDSLTLFENEEKKVPVIISKSLFPLITEKTINTARYYVNKYTGEDNENLNIFMIEYDYDYFKLVMRYFYLNI